MPTKFELHKQRWINCKACDLCNQRKHVVLLRGSVPSPVLFCGEAPGESEDVLGQPFVGPAGKLLDKIIRQATEVDPGKFAYTNLISCIPKDENGTKVKTPPKYAIEACSDRLRECVHLVEPKLVVWVGDEAKKFGPKILINHSPAFKTLHILHPAYILRALVAQQSMMVKQSVIKLRDALEQVL